jgi:DNA-directed RNA polymerase III subunit RPC11
LKQQSLFGTVEIICKVLLSTSGRHHVVWPTIARCTKSQLSLPCVHQSNHNHNHIRFTTIMWFCPLDGTLLQVRNRDGTSGCFYCATCPYSCNIPLEGVSKTTYFKSKVVDDILGGSQAWENVDRTQAQCPQCNHQEAYFMQIQIRSADEPMSIFYKCVKCSHQWNDK